MLKYITIVALACASALTPKTVAEDSKAPASQGGSAHSHFTKIPEKVEDVWKEIKKQQEKLASVVSRRDLGEAHDHAFAIRDLVKALPGKVSPDLKSKAEENSKAITRLASDIDKSSAARAQKATEDNVKKMDVAVAALRVAMNVSDPK